MEWISVEDREPPLKKYIFARAKGRRVPVVLRRVGVKDFYVYQTQEGLELTKITHWMPLPEPPRN